MKRYRGYIEPTHIAHRRSITDMLRGFILLAHPIPTTMFVTTVAIFSIRASWPHPVLNTIMLIILGHLTMQCSINMMNDYCDLFRDAVSQPEKPIVQGLVKPGEAFFVAVIMAILMVLLLYPLPPLALIVSLAYLILGQAYNKGLKSSIFSGFVLASMFALIPLYIFAGLGRLIPIAFWLVPIGFLMGAALNLANSLPDIEGDKKNGARTLAVVLGLRNAFLFCYILIATSLALIATLTLTHIVVSRLWITYPLLAFGIIALLVLLTRFGPNKPVATRKTFYHIIAVMCIVLSFSWFLSAS